MIKALSLAKAVVQINMCFMNEACNTCKYRITNDVCSARYLNNSYIGHKLSSLIGKYCNEVNCIGCVMLFDPYCDLTVYMTNVSRRKKAAINV